MAVDFFTVGQRIQKRRKMLHKTQEQMAEALSVTVGYISQIERGVTKIRLDTLSEESRLSPVNKRILSEIADVLEKNQAE